MSNKSIGAAAAGGCAEAGEFLLVLFLLSLTRLTRFLKGSG
jgi:hypothetical protein